MIKTKLILIFAILVISIPALCIAQFDFNLNDLFDNYDINPIPGSIVTNFYLIWSTNAYIPYGYQGRSLPSQGSEIIIEAVVNLSKGNADNLNYNWFIDGIFQEEKSGYGKNVFSFSALQHPGAYHVIMGQIFNEDKSIFQEKSIKIPVVEPEIVIESTTISPGREFSFIAKPYFFSIKKLTDLEFEWHFSGQEPIISSDYDASVLDLTVADKQTEEVLENNLWVSVKNKIQPRQKAFQTIKVQIY